MFIDELNQITKGKFRLPTEAEWEYAARGGRKSKGCKWAGCNDEKKLIDYAWYLNNSNSKYHQVKLKKPNELGIYDMSGNMLEWCYDYYSDYGTSPKKNPKGPVNGIYRVLRGGCYARSADDCRVDYRVALVSISRPTDVGFRLALDYQG